MMKKPRAHLLRFGLALVFFVSQGPLAYALESNLWAERRRALDQRRASPLQLAALPAATGNAGLPDLSLSHLSLSEARLSVRNAPDRLRPFLEALPPSLVTLRHISLASNPQSKIVLHLQDVHMNAEAQTRLSEAVRSLMGTRRLDLVALEGAFAPIDLKRFQTFPRKDILRPVANFLLESHEITGPLHAALLADHPAPVVGIDDPRAYQANVDAYLRAAPHLENQKEHVAREVRSLVQAKASEFSPDLHSLDYTVESYHAGRLPMSDYMQRLFSRPEARPGPMTRRFMEALGMEKSLDFAKVEVERRDVLQQLADRSSPEDRQKLLSAAVAYRAGRLSHVDFYEALRRLCADAGISLARQKSLDAYVRYVVLADSIDGEVLFKETQALEDGLYASLARTPAEKALAARSRRARLLGKLVDFSLVPEEWRALSHDAGSLNEQNWEPFATFYAAAESRDEAMALNLLAQMESGGAKTAVLVTGGFHGPGLEKRLRAQGVTVVSLAPRLTRAEAAEGAAYLSVFAQEKTPLEKLYAGEKLFVSPAPDKGLVNAGILGAGFSVSLDPSPPSLAQWVHDQWQTTRAIVTAAPQGAGWVRVAVTRGRQTAVSLVQSSGDKITGWRKTASRVQFPWVFLQPEAPAGFGSGLFAMSLPSWRGLFSPEERAHSMTGASQPGVGPSFRRNILNSMVFTGFVFMVSSLPLLVGLLAVSYDIGGLFGLFVMAVIIVNFLISMRKLNARISLYMEVIDKGFSKIFRLNWPRIGAEKLARMKRDAQGDPLFSLALSFVDEVGLAPDFSDVYQGGKYVYEGAENRVIRSILTKPLLLYLPGVTEYLITRRALGYLFDDIAKKAGLTAAAQDSKVKREVLFLFWSAWGNYETLKRAGRFWWWIPYIILEEIFIVSFVNLSRFFEESYNSARSVPLPSPRPFLGFARKLFRIFVKDRSILFATTARRTITGTEPVGRVSLAAASRETVKVLAFILSGAGALLIMSELAGRDLFPPALPSLGLAALAVFVWGIHKSVLLPEAIGPPGGWRAEQRRIGGHALWLGFWGVVFFYPFLQILGTFDLVGLSNLPLNGFTFSPQHAFFAAVWAFLTHTIYDAAIPYWNRFVLSLQRQGRARWLPVLPWAIGETPPLTWDQRAQQVENLARRINNMGLVSALKSAGYSDRGDIERISVLWGFTSERLARLAYLLGLFSTNSAIQAKWDAWLKNPAALAEDDFFALLCVGLEIELWLARYPAMVHSPRPEVLKRIIAQKYLKLPSETLFDTDVRRELASRGLPLSVHSWTWIDGTIRTNAIHSRSSPFTISLRLALDRLEAVDRLVPDWNQAKVWGPAVLKDVSRNYGGDGGIFLSKIDQHWKGSLITEERLREEVRDFAWAAAIWEDMRSRRWQLRVQNEIYLDDLPLMGLALAQRTRVINALKGLSETAQGLTGFSRYDLREHHPGTLSHDSLDVLEKDLLTLGLSLKTETLPTPSSAPGTPLSEFISRIGVLPRQQASLGRKLRAGGFTTIESLRDMAAKGTLRRYLLAQREPVWSDSEVRIILRALEREAGPLTPPDRTLSLEAPRPYRAKIHLSPDGAGGGAASHEGTSVGPLLAFLTDPALFRMVGEREETLREKTGGRKVRLRRIGMKTEEPVFLQQELFGRRMGAGSSRDLMHAEQFDLLMDGDRVLAIFPVFPPVRAQIHYVNLVEYYYEPPTSARLREMKQSGAWSVEQAKWDSFVAQAEKDNGLINAYKEFFLMREEPIWLELRSVHVFVRADRQAHQRHMVSLSAAQNPQGFADMKEQLSEPGDFILMPVLPTVPDPHFYQGEISDDRNYYSALLGSPKAAFGWEDAGPRDETAVGFAGSGLDTWIASLFSPGPLVAIDINPISILNVRLVARLGGFAGRLETHVMDNFADEDGRLRLRNPGGSARRFKRVIGNMPSHDLSPRDDSYSTSLARRVDNAPPQTLKIFSAALPELLIDDGLSLLWNKANPDQQRRDEVLWTLRTAGVYLDRPADQRDQAWVDGLPKPMDAQRVPFGPFLSTIDPLVVRHNPGFLPPGNPGPSSGGLPSAHAALGPSDILMHGSLYTMLLPFGLAVGSIIFVLSAFAPAIPFASSRGQIPATPSARAMARLVLRAALGEPQGDLLNRIALPPFSQGLGRDTAPSPEVIAWDDLEIALREEQGVPDPFLTVEGVQENLLENAARADVENFRASFMENKTPVIQAPVRAIDLAPDVFARRAAQWREAYAKAGLSEAQAARIVILFAPMEPGLEDLMKQRAAAEGFGCAVQPAPQVFMDGEIRLAALHEAYTDWSATPSAQDLGPIALALAPPLGLPINRQGLPMGSPLENIVYLTSVPIRAVDWEKAYRLAVLIAGQA